MFLRLQPRLALLIVGLGTILISMGIAIAKSQVHDPYEAYRTGTATATATIAIPALYQYQAHFKDQQGNPQDRTLSVEGMPADRINSLKEGTILSIVYSAQPGSTVIPRELVDRPMPTKNKLPPLLVLLFGLPLGIGIIAYGLRVSNQALVQRFGKREA